MSEGSTTFKPQSPEDLKAAIINGAQQLLERHNAIEELNERVGQNDPRFIKVINDFHTELEVMRNRMEMNHFHKPRFNEQRRLNDFFGSRVKGVTPEMGGENHEVQEVDGNQDVDDGAFDDLDFSDFNALLEAFKDMSNAKYLNRDTKEIASKIFSYLEEINDDMKKGQEKSSEMNDQ